MTEILLRWARWYDPNVVAEREDRTRRAVERAADTMQVARSVDLKLVMLRRAAERARLRLR